MRKVLTIVTCLLILFAGTSCRQANRVSRNLSQEADSFNVTRKLTVINQRTDTVLFQLTGNFSLQNEGHGELAVIGENDDGRYYKHFVYLGAEVTYIVEDMGGTNVSRHKMQTRMTP
jgi:hypothetical protein